MSRVPPTTWAEVDALDTSEVLDGYQAGKEGWPEPGDNHSFAFWVGWRNGACDGGHRETDSAQISVIRDFLKSSAAKQFGEAMKEIGFGN